MIESSPSSTLLMGALLAVVLPALCLWLELALAHSAKLFNVVWATGASLLAGTCLWVISVFLRDAYKILQSGGQVGQETVVVVAMLIVVGIASIRSVYSITTKEILDE